MTPSLRAFAVLRLSLLGGLALVACEQGAANHAVDPSDAAGAMDAAGTDDTALPADPAPPGCRPGRGASGTPTSIHEAVRLINSLPRPVTVACFLESLDRPLHASASQSTISLQPAAGRRSPRIFLLTDALVMSIVADGMGRNLVEFGQFVTPTRTLKGEMAFPVVNEVPPATPYERIRSDNPATGANGTSCRFCHSYEEPAPQITGAVAYVSGAFRPDARTEVPLADVYRERQACNPTLEPDRCALLGALFDHGDVVATPFPKAIPTIFN